MARVLVLFTLSVIVGCGAEPRAERGGIGDSATSATAPAITVHPIGWIGLYTDSLMARLENENRIDELCPASAGSDFAQRCRVEKLAATSQQIVLRTAPDADAPSAGALRLVVTPGKGVQFLAVTPGGAATEFTPDLYLEDWGYGPYYHQTIAAQQGDWYAFPLNPFPGRMWINVRDLGDNADWKVRLLQPGDIVSTPQGDLVIVSVDTAAVVARPEQPADMWCDASDPPPLKPLGERRIPHAELYDGAGHLVVRLKYLKGC